MKKILLAIPLLAAIAISCQEKVQEEKESVKIEGIGDTVDFAATPDAAVSFTIETNVDWSIAKTQLDWLSISPMKGTAKDGVQTIALDAENNTAEESRSGSFTLTAGATTKTVTVTQAALVVVPNFVVNGLDSNTLSFSGEENIGKVFALGSESFPKGDAHRAEEEEVFREGEMEDQEQDDQHDDRTEDAVGQNTVDLVRFGQLVFLLLDLSRHDPVANWGEVFVSFIGDSRLIIVFVIDQESLDLFGFFLELTNFEFILFQDFYGVV